MSYQENMHQSQVTKSLLEVEEKIAEKSSDLEIKYGNAKYRHMKYPDMLSIPDEYSHLNALLKYWGIYSTVRKKGVRSITAIVKNIDEFKKSGKRATSMGTTLIRIALSCYLIS